MQQLILNRDTNREGKYTQLKIFMPLFSTDDTVVEEHVTQKSDSMDVNISANMLQISVTGKIGKGGYSKLIAKVYHDKDLKKLLRQQSDMWDKSRSDDLFLYNQFRLMWIGLCLDDDQLCSWTVFPIDIGANTLDESIANMNLINSIKVSIDKDAAKKLAGKTAGDALLGYTGVKLVSSALMTYAGPEMVGIGHAVTSAVGVTATAAVATPVIIVAVPLAIVGGAMVVGKTMLSAEEKKLNKLVDVCFALAAQANTLNYCNKEEITGIVMWRELSNLASVFGSKSLLELDKQIKDLT